MPIRYQNSSCLPKRMGTSIPLTNVLTKQLMLNVRACMPAFSLIEIHVVISGILLQTWMAVIVGVDV